jgi:tight adherence protein B
MWLWFLLFISCLMVFGFAVLLWWEVSRATRKQKLIDTIKAGIEPAKAAVRTTVLVGGPPARPRGLARFFQTTDEGLEAGGGTGWSRGKFLMLTLAMAVIGGFSGMPVGTVLGPIAPLLGGIALGVAPWAYKNRKRKTYLSAIETQFPDALDFLARSVRAGNAFSIGLELLGEETSEPLKSEVLRITREMALGAQLVDALHGLIARVPLVEIRFFVSAVLLQRETGGNLAEILAKLAISVRERLRLRGQVRASSGQSRLTATVLSVLPIATLVMLKMVSPEYLDNLTKDPMGPKILGAALVSQILGYLVMKKITNIEV